MNGIDQQLLLKIRRKRGELNISIIRMALDSGISRDVLAKIISGTKTRVNNNTFEKLNNWLLEEKK